MIFKRFTLFVLIVALAAGMASAISAQDESGKSRSGAGGFNALLQEATGLDADALRQAIRDGATPAELIEANGGDLTAVIADMVADANSAIEAASSERLAQLSDDITAFVSGDRGKGRRGMAIRGASMISILEEATGLDLAGLRAALADGSTPAELIEANDGDLSRQLATRWWRQPPRR